MTGTRHSLHSIAHKARRALSHSSINDPINDPINELGDRFNVPYTVHGEETKGGVVEPKWYRRGSVSNVVHNLEIEVDGYDYVVTMVEREPGVFSIAFDSKHGTEIFGMTGKNNPLKVASAVTQACIEFFQRKKILLRGINFTPMGGAGAGRDRLYALFVKTAFKKWNIHGTIRDSRAGIGKDIEIDPPKQF